MTKTVAKLDTSKMDELIDNADPKAIQIVSGTAFRVEGYAKVNAPYDTGALRNSLQAEEKDGPINWWVHDGVEYGIFQELGFHHWITGVFIQNPFMIPAVEQVRPDWDRAWRDFFR